MKKELFIIFLILVFVIVGDFFVQKYVHESFDTISNSLRELQSNPQYSNEQKNKIIDEMNMFWNNRFEKLTCIVEHSEVEKIKNGLISVSAGIDTGDDNYVYQEVEKTIYAIEHLEDKQTLKLYNIF